MLNFDSFWGEKVPDQEVYNQKHFSLYGEFPNHNDILAGHDIRGAVIFDGKIWRSFDLQALEARRAVKEASDCREHLS